jgi:hypothetical protein
VSHDVPESRDEEPRSKLRGIFQGISLNGNYHTHSLLAIHPCSKLQDILAFSHNRYDGIGKRVQYSAWRGYRFLTLDEIGS